MNEYEYSINEEITRWVLEVYINNHTDNWKIAFTNPTAGPWKKIIAPSTSKEIYRFIREEARPDLIIVNDILSTILIIEAKDDYRKLLDNAQMKKSIDVYDNISRIYDKSSIKDISKKKHYNKIPSFLWFSKDIRNILNESDKVIELHDSLADTKRNIINIVILQKSNGNLYPHFIYDKKIYEDIGQLSSII